jgi:isopentenyl-diphosphate delta-isomerase
MNELVILVNEKDEPLGTMDKLEVHQKGFLHRAFSTFIFNDSGQLLLQRRAMEKYHSANLWTNTCCGHPRPEEHIIDAAKRRLKEEMGIETNLEKKFDFIYRAQLDNNLIEHELDHVFIGQYNDSPILNKNEASEYNWVSISKLKYEIKQYPQKYSEWLKIAIHSFS